MLIFPCAHCFVAPVLWLRSAVLGFSPPTVWCPWWDISEVTALGAHTVAPRWWWFSQVSLPDFCHPVCLPLLLLCQAARLCDPPADPSAAVNKLQGLKFLHSLIRWSLDSFEKLFFFLKSYFLRPISGHEGLSCFFWWQNSCPTLLAYGHHGSPSRLHQSSGSLIASHALPSLSFSPRNKLLISNPAFHRSTSTWLVLCFLCISIHHPFRLATHLSHTPL